MAWRKGLSIRLFFLMPTQKFFFVIQLNRPSAKMREIKEAPAHKPSFKLAISPSASGPAAVPKP